VDDYTRYTWVLFLVDKSDVFATFKSFVKGIHNEFETTIKRVRSDNGSEFKNIRIDELCDEFGIRHQFSAKSLHNQLVLLRERIEHSLIWQGLCLVSTI
jgi:transposase InsO family protein